MIQVKSCWSTNPDGLPIKNFDCNFVAAVMLNRGSTIGSKPALSSSYDVFRIGIIAKLPRSNYGDKV